jgi:hypothetical protein
LRLQGTWMDGRTGWFLYTPQTLFAWGIIKWHIKWKCLIQKFHDICLSYYFNRKTQNSCWTTNCHVATIKIWALLIIIKQKGQLKTFLFLVTAAILNGGRDCRPQCWNVKEHHHTGTIQAKKCVRTRFIKKFKLKYYRNLYVSNRGL